ncbi:MAG: phytanoyl-CoA dioxygenase family protein [Verrucomicrobiota bacterium]
MNADGCQLFEAVLRRDGLNQCQAEAARLEPTRPEGRLAKRGGLRDALGQSAVFRDLAWRGGLRQLAVQLLGPAARPVRGILFDKNPSANWLVPMHQDVTIAVRERAEADGFGPWSVKDGTPHVQPPVRVLERIVALRLHLDDCPETNGALRVLPTTHRQGKLSAEEIRALADTTPEVVCPAVAGDVLAMRPLLLHASSPARVPARRRVLHVEFAAVVLPPTLAWAEGEPARRQS